jgi:glycosyltransferase involved in cell wall biosynthesis
MRIALLVAKFEPGGLLNVNTNVCSGLAQKGHQVSLVSATVDPGTFTSLPAGAFSLGANSSLQSFFRLRSSIFNGDFDVVIVSQLFMGLVALVSRPRHSSTSLLIVEHSSLEYWKESPKIKDRLVLLLSKVLLGKTDQIAAVSKETTKSINEQFRSLKRPAVYLPNPVLNGNELVFKEEEEKAVIRSGLVFAGRLVPGKRVPDIIHAFAQIASEVPDDLTILGDGPEMQICVNLVNELGLNDRVFFKGFVDNVTEFFQVAKCLVLASESEGLPTVLIEALAQGCQVVSTDCPTGPREILDNGKFGGLVTVGDQSMMVEKIEEALLSTPKVVGLANHLGQYTQSASIGRYEMICYEASTFRIESFSRRDSLKQ